MSKQFSITQDTSIAFPHTLVIKNDAGEGQSKILAQAEFGGGSVSITIGQKTLKAFSTGAHNAKTDMKQSYFRQRGLSADEQVMAFSLLAAADAPNAAEYNAAIQDIQKQAGRY